MKDRDLWVRLKDCAFPLQDGKSTLRRRLNAMTRLGEERVDRVIDEYRRYLYLAAIGPIAVPSKLVDYVRHMHLEDTRAYAAFCADVIGKFIHHAPGRPSQRYDPAYPNTLKAYSAEFGEHAFWRIWPHRIDPIVKFLGVLPIALVAGSAIGFFILRDWRFLMGIVPAIPSAWLGSALSPWSASAGLISGGSSPSGGGGASCGSGGGDGCGDGGGCGGGGD